MDVSWNDESFLTLAEEMHRLVHAFSHVSCFENFFARFFENFFFEPCLLVVLLQSKLAIPIKDEIVSHFSPYLLDAEYFKMRGCNSLCFSNPFYVDVDVFPQLEFLLLGSEQEMEEFLMRMGKQAFHVDRLQASDLFARMTDHKAQIMTSGLGMFGERGAVHRKPDSFFLGFGKNLELAEVTHLYSKIVSGVFSQSMAPHVVQLQILRRTKDVRVSTWAKLNDTGDYGWATVLVSSEAGVDFSHHHFGLQQNMLKIDWTQPE